MFAYGHEEINFLLSVLSICFLFYDLNLNTQGSVYLDLLSIFWSSIETCKVSRKCNVYIPVIQLFIYRNVQAFFLNKSYMFPMLGFAKIEYWSP